MADSTIPTSSEATGDPTDAIADLLLGGEGGKETEEPETEKEQDEDDPDNTEVDEDEGAPDNDEASTDEDEGEAAEADGDDDRTLSQLLGLNDDQVSVSEESGDLLISTNINGVKSQVKFDEVLAGYQTQKANTLKSKALADERRGFEAQAQLKVNEIRAGLEQNDALTQQLQHELLKEFEGTNWDQLRQQDPAEYAARQQDQSVRYNQIQGIQQQITQQKQAIDQQNQQKMQEAHGSFVQAQKQIMMDANPTWGDPEKFKAARVEMREFLTGEYGYSDEEIEQVVDARQIALIKDAMAFRKGSKVAEKKIKTVPKMQKSKGKKRSKVSKLDRLTNAAKTATGSNRRAAEVDAIAELLSGG